MAKYGSLYLYDIDLEKRYTIDNEDMQFVKKEVLSLIDIPD